MKQIWAEEINEKRCGEGIEWNKDMPCKWLKQRLAKEINEIKMWGENEWDNDGFK